MQCKAIAHLALGDPNLYELVNVTLGERFIDLAVDFKVDVLTQFATHTMGRDVYEPMSNSSLWFSTPYLYGGMVFAGIPNYVECADRLDSRVGTCRELQVCVGENTTHVIFQQRIDDAVENHIQSNPDQDLGTRIGTDKHIHRRFSCERGQENGAAV